MTNSAVSQWHPGARMQQLRVEHGISARQTAEWLSCTERTITNYEAPSGSMPPLLFEEFVKRLREELERRSPPSESTEELVVVSGEDGRPIDVIAQQNYHDHWAWNDDTVTVESIASERRTGKPTWSKTTFSRPGNDHVLSALIRWKRNRMLSEMRDVDRDIEGPYKMLAWLASEVRASEEANPDLVKAKRKVARRARALALAAPNEFDECKVELDEALHELALAIGNRL